MALGHLLKPPDLGLQICDLLIFAPAFALLVLEFILQDFDLGLGIFVQLHLNPCLFLSFSFQAVQFVPVLNQLLFLLAEQLLDAHKLLLALLWLLHLLGAARLALG